MSNRLTIWLKDNGQCQCIEAALQNGNIEKPDWMGSGFTGIGFAVWDTAESDGGLGLETFTSCAGECF